MSPPPISSFPIPRSQPLYSLYPRTNTRSTDRPVPQRFDPSYLISRRRRRAVYHALSWWGRGWRAIHEVSRTAKEQGSIWAHQRRLRAVYARPCMLGKDRQSTSDNGCSYFFGGHNFSHFETSFFGPFSCIVLIQSGCIFGLLYLYLRYIEASRVKTSLSLHILIPWPQNWKTAICRSRRSEG